MEKVVGKSVKDVNLFEIRELLDELKGAADNLTCVRWGIAKGLEVCINPEMYDNALYMINQRLDDIVERLDKELYEREEV